MLITIHDANLQKVAFIDNDKQGTLNYYNDVWTRNLETGSSTFEFSVFKKAIQSDTALHKTYNALNKKAFISFKYHGKSYVFSVMTVEENEDTIKCYCENLNLELINEYANPYKSDKPKSFVEYCNAMDLLNFTHLTVGINEISDKKLTLEWEGQDTKLARLLSLATKFDAEIDFDTQLNADSTIKSFKVNVYHENDDTHQGVGRVRNDVQLVYGKNLKSITRKIDKTGIYTMVVPTGKRTVKNGKGEEVEEIVTIGSLKPAYSENNKDGVREFYQSGNALYAPIAAQMYPSTFTTGTQADQWIRKDLEVDSDNPTVIRAAGIRNLKKNAYPALSYIVDGFLDVEIGDTIKIFDDAFVPALLVLARVSEQKISFSNPANNKTVFANFKELERNLSAGIQAAFERLFEASKPYLIKLSTDNGVIFKNQAGQTIINPTLYKGGKVISNDVTWRWSLDGNVTTGMTYTVKGSNVANTVTLTVAAYIGNDEVAVDEITLVNVTDGKNGAKGDKGERGEKGAIDEEKLKEIEQNINSKADGTLTQEQLNALNEKNSIMRAEWEAKASLDTLNKAIAEYKRYTLKNDKDKAKSEKDLISLNQRLVENIRNLKELAERWNFLDKYFQVGNEGIIFGEQNGNTCAKMSNDRFSIFSAGTEVMYISQGTLFIENGIFSKSIQIGRFREEQYNLNLDMNVIRYVGGI
ncbi:phage tail spike protein [Streptococcus anginosus]|jgi:phage minor structural protein|nr:phage tail spike protein [Streptococcus anginosus]MED5905938.1 phage tail spike protein [Streptococcus anginosus]